MTISAAEQLLVELINRARLDPSAEAARLGIDLNQGLSAGTISTAAQQVLAPNDQLENAAIGHSLWMLQTDIFSHTGSGGSSPGDRMTAAGYVFEGSWRWGENISWSGTTGTVNLNTAIVQHYESLFFSAGHRANTLNASYREIGVSQELGQFASGGRVYNASVLTEDFARSGSALFVTGVAIRDSDSDHFYDIGEGRGGYWVGVTGQRATTQTAGGYTLELPSGAISNGKVSLNLGLGDSALGQVEVEVNNSNAKLDMVIGSDGAVALALSASATLISGINEAWLLGCGNLNLAGSAANDRLTGNSGNNILKGGAGSDALIGGRGNDTYNIDGGDTITEGANAGTDTVQSAATLVLAANLENLTLTGSSNIHGTGNSGVNRIVGNAGSNSINGGGGSDSLTGGSGADNFVFSHATGAGNVDAITDFNAAADTIRLDDAVFVGLSVGGLAGAAFAANDTGNAGDPSDRIIYEKDTGYVFFDSDGTGSAARVLFADLASGLTITNADFIVF